MAESAEEKRGREQLSRMAYEAQLLQGQGRALEQQMGALSEGIAQLGVAIESLKSMKAAGSGNALVPIGGGAMVRAKLENGGKVLLDIGAGVVAEKDIGEAVVILEKRLSETEKARGGAEREIATLSRRLQAIDHDARALMHKLKLTPGEG